MCVWACVPVLAVSGKNKNPNLRSWGRKLSPELRPAGIPKHICMCSAMQGAFQDISGGLQAPSPYCYTLIYSHPEYHPNTTANLTSTNLNV